MSDCDLAAELDFSLYRKPELAERIGSLLSLPGVLRTIVKWGAVIILATWMVLALLYLFHQRVHWSLTLFMVLYGTMVAAVSGVALGCLIALNRALDHAVEVFDLSLEVTEQATRDLAGLRQGGKKLPSPGKLLTGVHDHVLLPMVKGALQGQSRWLAWLLFPTFRWSLDLMLRRVVKHLESRDADFEPSAGNAGEQHDERWSSESADPIYAGAADAFAQSACDKESPASVATLEPLAATADTLSSMTQWLSATRLYVSSYGGVVRRAVITPLSLFFALFVAVAFTPALLVWYFMG